MIKRNILFFLYSFVIIYCLFYGARAWPTWFLTSPYLYLSFLIIVVIFFSTNKIRIRLTFIEIIAFLLYFVTFMSISDMSFNGLLGNFLIASIVSSVFLLSKKYAEGLLRNIQSVMFYILIPSLVLHFIFLFYNYPSPFIIQNEWSERYVFFNYFFLIKNEILYQNRFCGIFLEPGYLAALCSFLLFVDKYDLKKKENKILVLAVMVSLSLAGYIFLAVGYMLLRANKIVDLLKKIFGLLFYVLLFYTIFTNYDDGDNIVNKSIIERLQLDKEKGIKGNNRVTGVVDDYYDFFLKSDELWSGYGKKEMQRIRQYESDWIAAGYKPFLMQNGIFILMMILLFYLIIAIDAKNRLYSMSFLLIIILYFTAVGELFSEMWIILFLLGIRLNNLSKTT